MTAACSSLCFSQQTFETAAAHMARMAFKAVDIAVIQNWAHFSPKEMVEEENGLEKQIERAQKTLKTYRLKAAALNASAGASESKAELPRFQAICDFANAVGASVVCYAAPLQVIDYEKTLRRYEPLLEIAQNSGVVLAVEAHARTLLEIPEKAVKFCEDLEGVKLTLDPSHMWAGENQGAPFDDLYPFVAHTHWRDGGESWDQAQLPVGKGVVPFREVLNKLADAGYSGAYSVEYIDTFPNGGEANILRMKEILNKNIKGKKARSEA